MTRQEIFKRIDVKKRIEKTALKLRNLHNLNTLNKDDVDAIYDAIELINHLENYIINGASDD